MTQPLFTQQIQAILLKMVLNKFSHFARKFAEKQATSSVCLHVTFAVILIILLYPTEGHREGLET